jgi:UDP-N-acetylmuramate-alanine ligase
MGSEKALGSDQEILKKGAKVYFIGIKGTGMCALAELMQKSGMVVSGSDREEVFYTDDILRELGIPFYERFDASHIGKGEKPRGVAFRPVNIAMPWERTRRALIRQG